MELEELEVKYKELGKEIERLKKERDEIGYKADPKRAELVLNIIDSVSKEFNSLPDEEQKKICKYTSEMQILTLWQMLYYQEGLMCPTYRGKLKGWLDDCVHSFSSKYEIEKE